MFGFSLAKFLVLALVVAAIWYGFKYMNRLEEVRRMLRQEQRRRQGADGRAPGRRAESLKTEDLVLCRTCNAYVAARGAGACGRADCPWRR
jgi:hypothetical protein